MVVIHKVMSLESTKDTLPAMALNLMDIDSLV